MRSSCPAVSASAASKARSRAIRYARENDVPYLGICLGMQLAVIEYARHQAALADANSTEFDADDAASGRRARHRMAESRRHDRAAQRAVRSGRNDAARRAALRGRARHARAPDLRGDDASPSVIVTATKSTIITCRASRRPVSSWARGRKSAVAGDLCEMIELADHPWFFGCQFHPEFTSNPRRGHPLFIALRQGGARAAARARRRSGRRASPSWSRRISTRIAR